MLYDNETGNILYVSAAPENPRKVKVVVAPDYWDSRAKATLNSTRAVFKVGGQALRDRKRYTVISGEIK